MTPSSFTEKANPPTKEGVAAAHQSDLPAEVLEAIDGARKYAEGRPVRTEVRTKADLGIATRVAAIKMAN